MAFKRTFNLAELYLSFVYFPGGISKLVENRKGNILDGQFIERLHLAVTEVNGCAACSYQHTKMALGLGMSNEEICSFLSGDESYIKPEEAKAILFAQHFAESKGIPKKYAYDAIVKEYGATKAGIILGACQVIIAGNMVGIPFSAFQSRLKGKAYKDSTLFYELGMLIGGFFCISIALIHGLLRKLFCLANERFDKETDEE